MKNQTEVSNKSIARHTPGPWTVEKNKEHWECNRGIPIYHHTIQIARAIEFNSKTVSPKESLANAWLIAAAPELLESCKEMMSLLKLQEEYGRPVISGQVRERAKQAIDKAEGR